jgi:hypothetical protein
LVVGAVALVVGLLAWRLPQQPASGTKINVTISPSAYDVDASRWRAHGPFYEAGGDLHARHGVSHAHAYGNPVGRFVYQVELGEFEDEQVELRARLSADAGGYSDPEGRYSDVTVVVNGAPLPVRRVMPDDGHGAHYTWQFDAGMLRPGENTIEFAVAEDAQFPHGLAIYGSAVAPGQADEHITLRGK